MKRKTQNKLTIKSKEKEKIDGEKEREKRDMRGEKREAETK